MNVFDQIKQEAKTIIQDGSENCHDWEHTLRVLRNCEHIGKLEKADMEILRLAAILHDIGRPTQTKSKHKICHAAEGAKLAQAILTKHNFPQSKIDQIIHCILAHRSRTSETPTSLEAKILFDADKLDGIGAIGIARNLFFAASLGAKIHDPDVNLKPEATYTIDDTAYREFLINHIKAKDKMFTKSAKAMAQTRHDFQIEFFDRLNQEWAGKI